MTDKQPEDSDLTRAPPTQHNVADGLDPEVRGPLRRGPPDKKAGAPTALVDTPAIAGAGLEPATPAL